MKGSIVALFIIVVLFNSCSVSFGAYIRNLSAQMAVIDVYLLSKENMQTLPNKVKVSNSVVKFKSGFRQKLDHYQNITWVDTSHFKYEIKPQTSIDLADMTGPFMNSHPRTDIIVVVSANDKHDTLVNGSFNFYRDKFQFKNVGISSPLFYYDVK